MNGVGEGNANVNETEYGAGSSSAGVGSVIQLGGQIVIPRCWDQLLRLRDIGGMIPRPRKAKHVGRESDSAEHVSDPSPYRDDVRTVRHEDSGWAVEISLVSGSSNYFLETAVSRQGSAPEEGAFAEMPETVQELFATGDGSAVEVVAGNSTVLRVATSRG